GSPVCRGPLGLISSLVSAMRAFSPDSYDSKQPDDTNLHIIRLLAKLPTIATWSYKESHRHPVNYPNHKLDYCSNFLHMMFSLPVDDYVVVPVVSKAINKLL